MLCSKLGDEATRSVYIFTGHPFGDHMDKPSATCEDREFGSKRTGTRGEVVDRNRLRYEVFREITGIRNGCSEGLLGHGQRVLNPASAIL